MEYNIEMGSDLMGLYSIYTHKYVATGKRCYSDFIYSDLHRHMFYLKGINGI